MALVYSDPARPNLNDWEKADVGIAKRAAAAATAIANLRIPLDITEPPAKRRCLPALKNVHSDVSFLGYLPNTRIRH